MLTLTLRNSCLSIVGLMVAANLTYPGKLSAQGFGGGYPSQPTTIDFGGGSGGRNVTNATCNPGSVAVGFRARTGEYFNQLWLECSPLRPDGELGGGRQVTSPAGQPGGRAEHSARCPMGQVLRGLKGRAGASIDQVSGVCSSPAEVRQRDSCGGGTDLCSGQRNGTVCASGTTELQYPL